MPCVANCSRMHAFGRVARVQGDVGIGGWASISGVVGDGKLGMSSDAGGTAVWSDLPVTGPSVQWMDAAKLRKGWRLFLGTDSGAVSVEDGGTRWERHEAGLPAGQLEKWLRTKTIFGLPHCAKEECTFRAMPEKLGSEWITMPKEGDPRGLVETHPECLQ